MSQMRAQLDEIAAAKSDLETALVRCARFVRKCAAWDAEAARLARGVELAVERMEATAVLAQTVVDAESQSA